MYKKILINGAESLPKDTGIYFAFIRDDQEIQQWTYNKGSDTDDSVDWLNAVDWYLVESPISVPTEGELSEQFPIIDYNGCTAIERVNIGFINSSNENKRIGAKWAIDEIIKRNK